MSDTPTPYIDKAYILKHIKQSELDKLCKEDDIQGIADDASTSVTLKDAAAAWTASQFINYTVMIIAGTGNGQSRVISANTTNILTVPAWATTPDHTSKYKILGKVNDDYLTQAVATADSFIDGYLKKVVTSLPLESPSESIKQCAYNITIYNLHDRIQYMDIPAWVSEKYKSTISFLKDISNGNADIGDLPDDILNSQIYYQSEDPYFDRGAF